MSRPYVKSRGTEVPVSRSQGELERILRRYGASGFAVQNEYTTHVARVFFRVPDSPGQPSVVPVRLEVSIEAVARRLGYFDKGKQPTDFGWAAAERTAWRHLVLWVDAALSAAGAGLQNISEAFLAHVLVRDGDGKTLRVIDQMNAHAAGGDWRLALPPGDG